MRSSGVVDATSGFGRHDHLCWSYDDRASLAEAARAFLAEGVALGQRVVYVGSRSTAALRDELVGLHDLDALLDSGAASIHTIEDRYRTTDRAGSGQDDVYAEATRHALDLGYTGLRVVADATELVLDDAGRDAFVRYEHAIDRRMSAGLPFSAMCAYDTGRLGARTVAELACVHPLHRSGTTPFHVFADGDGDGRLAIAGEVDALGAADLRRALHRVLGDVAPGTVELEASRLDFADHRALLTLEAAAAQAGVELVLLDPPSVITRLTELLPLRSVRVATA